MQNFARHRAMARRGLLLCFLLSTFGCGDADPVDEGGGTGGPLDESGDASGSGDDDGSGDASGSGGDGAGSGGEDALPIVGEWIETFPDGGGTQTHTITELEWAMDSDFGSSLHHVDGWDVQARVLVAQSDPSNEFNPGAWGKFQWQFVDDVLYYCQPVFDAATPEAAWMGDGADLDLEAGCAGFAWSRLDPG